MLVFFSFSSYANRQVKHFWPRIPFNIQGANLCEFTSAYSQTRSEYMNEMVGLAERLLYAGDFEPVKTLYAFNQMYQQNLNYAKRGLGVTLESTFKSYLNSYYRKLRPRTRALEFKHTNNIASIMNNALSGRLVNYVSNDDVDKIDLFAYGTYSISESCNGNIVVSMTIIDKDGFTKDYIKTGHARTVMSKIASEVFEDFQRTKFPSTIKLPNKSLTLLGDLNGEIGTTSYLRDLKNICSIVGGRLPSRQEYHIIDSYGSWNGGIDLGRNAWAVNYYQVYYKPLERNGGYPVIAAHRINEREYKYLCVK